MFFETRKEHKKGPNNIVDMWKELNLGAFFMQYPFSTNVSIIFRDRGGGG